MPDDRKNVIGLPIPERSLFGVSDEEGAARILYRPAELAHPLSQSC